VTESGAGMGTGAHGLVRNDAATRPAPNNSMLAGGGTMDTLLKLGPTKP